MSKWFPAVKNPEIDKNLGKHILFWHVAIRGKIKPPLQPKCRCSSTKIFSQQRHLSHIPNLLGHLHRTPVTDRTFNFTLRPLSLKRCTFQLNGFKQMWWWRIANNGDNASTGALICVESSDPGVISRKQVLPGVIRGNYGVTSSDPGVIRRKPGKVRWDLTRRLGATK